MKDALLLCLWLACVSAVAGANNFHQRNHTGLLFLYTFGEGQLSDTAPSWAVDVSGRGLLGNLTTTNFVSWSSSRQGISVPSSSGGARAQSQRTSSSLLSQLSSEFTLEFFFLSPINPLSKNLLIAGFGEWPSGSEYQPCDFESTGWRLSSYIASAIDFDAVLSVGGTPTCVARSISIAANTLRHLVVRAHDGTLSIVSQENTVAAVGPTLVFSPSLWARHPAPLTIANPHTTTGWTGSLFMVAMYDRYLSDTEISSNYATGPPNSFPTPTPTLSIPEDETTTLYP